MSEPEIRIGDTEREEALKVLGAHMSAGRLDLDEYGERSARITTAKTRGELSALFGDLPAPHPVFEPLAAVPLVATPSGGGMQISRRLASVAVPATGLLCVALFFAVRNPIVFVLVPVVALLVGAMYGDDRRRRRR